MIGWIRAVHPYMMAAEPVPGSRKARNPAFAIETGGALDPYKLYWIEEPVAAGDIDGGAAVAGALATPIAG